MKYKWLYKENNSRVILFFNGWGMDEAVISHLLHEDYDVVMFYDYNTLECDFDFSELNNKQKYLIAWSMGVMCAALFDIKYEKKVAINGTLKPIDDDFGIPRRIYDLTIKGFNPKGAEKFIQNMFNEPVKNFSVSREFENQKTELSALKNYKADINFQYDKVWISDNDKIIPTKNQVKFWNQEPNLKSGHAPFNLFSKWSELL